MKAQATEQLKKYLEEKSVSYKIYLSKNSVNRTEIHEKNFDFLKKDITTFDKEKIFDKIEDLYSQYFFLAGILADKNLPAELRAHVINQKNDLNNIFIRYKKVFPGLKKCFMLDYVLFGKGAPPKEFHSPIIAAAIARCYPFNEEVATLALEQSNHVFKPAAKRITIAGIDQYRTTERALRPTMDMLINAPNSERANDALVFLTKIFSGELDEMTVENKLPALVTRLEDYADIIDKASSENIARLNQLKFHLYHDDDDALEYNYELVKAALIEIQRRKPGIKNHIHSRETPSLTAKLFQFFNNVMAFFTKLFAKDKTETMIPDQNVKTDMLKPDAATQTLKTQSKITSINMLYGHKCKHTSPDKGDGASGSSFKRTSR